jgi:hypothetical protein
MTRACPVCLIPHVAAIHAATLRIRRWLRERVKLALRPVEVGARRKIEGA